MAPQFETTAFHVPEKDLRGLPPSVAPMERSDVLRAAQALSALYAEDAVRQALIRADKLLRSGDSAGCEDWRRVAAVIIELDKGTPS